MTSSGTLGQLLIATALIGACACCSETPYPQLVDSYYAQRDIGAREASTKTALQIVALKPWEAEAWGCLGEALCEQRNWTGAVSALREAVRLGSASDADRRNLVTALTQAGWQRYDKGGAANSAAARVLWREACLVDPTDPWPRTSLGDLAADGGRLEQAEREYLAALQIAPSWPRAYIGLLRVYMATDRPRLAENCLQAALTFAPNDAACHYARWVVFSPGKETRRGQLHTSPGPQRSSRASPSISPTWPG